MRTAGTPPRREAEVAAQAVALVRMNFRLADGHEERAGAHHDRERGLRVHAEQAHHDQAGAVEADAHLHERAQHEVADEAQRQRRPSGPARAPPPGAILKMVRRNKVAATSSATPMPIWTFRRGQPATTPAPSHEPSTGRDDHEDQGHDVDLDDGDVDQGLGDGGQRVAHVQRAGDPLVGHQVLELEDRAGRGERADAQGVEEVGDDADRESRGEGRAEASPSLPWPARASRPGPPEGPEIHDAHDSEAEKRAVFMRRMLADRRPIDPRATRGIGSNHAEANRVCRARPHGRAHGREHPEEGLPPHASGTGRPRRPRPSPRRGPTWRARPFELAERSDVVVACVADPAAVEELVFGPQGLIGGVRPGFRYIESSTVSPETTKRVAAALRERGGGPSRGPHDRQQERRGRGHPALHDRRRARGARGAPARLDGHGQQGRALRRRGAGRRP